jgi:hypothetical protein
MEITIVRTGGIAGIKAQLGPVDTVSLDTGGVITRKVQEIGFFGLPEELPKTGAPIPDGFFYAMTVAAEEGRHTVHYASDSEAKARGSLFAVQKLLIESGQRFKSEAPLLALSDPEGFSWEAWRNRMPGTHDPDLHVVGSCVFPTSGVRLSLEPGNVGIVPEPDLFVLNLTIEDLGSGDDRMTEKYVVWSGDLGPDVRRVRIQGDAEAEFTVTEAT